MKNFKLYFLLLALICSTTAVFAQRKETLLVDDIGADGVVKFRRFDVSVTKHPVSEERQLLKTVLAITGNDSLALLSTTGDELGFTHNFYQQYYKGIKVENYGYATHARNGNIEILNGNFTKLGNPAAVARLTEADALQAALKFTGAQKYKWEIPAEEVAVKQIKNDKNATFYPKGELLIRYDYMQSKTFRLAYKFAIEAQMPASSRYVYVDALTGGIIALQDIVLHTNITSNITTTYSSTQSITNDQYLVGGVNKYRLRETRGPSSSNLQTFNSQLVQSLGQTDFVDNDNTWAASYNANHDNVALDAHWAQERIFDYWNTVRGRNSYNGLGADLITYVHYDATDNGGWSSTGHYVAMGDGHTHFKPITSLDALAHEFGHGYTQFAQASPILTFDYGHPESGALNEGISDIWGAVVENWSVINKYTWEIGEDIMLDGAPCNRSLLNPKTGGDNSTDLTPTSGYPDTYLKTKWYPASNLNIFDGTTLSAFVHVNSTVISHWFFLLSAGGSGTNDLGNAYSVTGIGIDKAASIVWRAEQNYLTATSAYSDARTAMINAATDLYCANSAEVAAVTKAWYAVGVGANFTGTLSAISGPANICTPVTYTVVNPPAGVTSKVWSVDYPMYVNIVPGTGAASRVGGSNALATILVAVNGAGGCVSHLSYPVTVGSVLTGTVTQAGAGTPLYTVNSVASGAASATFNWTNMTGITCAQTSTNPPVSTTGFFYNSGTHTFSFTLASGQSITVSLGGTSTCGGANNATLAFYVMGGHLMAENKYKIYPNPATGIVNISTVTLSSASSFMAQQPAIAEQDAAKATTVNTGKEKTVDLPGAGIAQVQLFDITGRLRKTYNFSGRIQKTSINVSGLAPGTYVVKIFDGTGYETQKVIIQK